MARKPDIQYIRQFYVPGSEAQVIEFKPAQPAQKTQPANPQPTTQTQCQPHKKQKQEVDVVAVCGSFLLIVTLVLMLAGMFQLHAATRENRKMEEYVLALKNERAVLQRDYESGYDLNQIQEMAKSLGMVPKEQVQTFTINPVVPQPEPEPSWWENLCWFMKGLFA